MNKKILFLSILIALFLFTTKVSATDTEFNITDINEDGFTKNQAGVYTRDNTSPTIWMGSFAPQIFRGYIEFNISTLQNSTIDEVKFFYNGAVNVEDANLTLLTVRPSVTSNNTLYWAIGNGTVIGNKAGFPVVAPQQSLDINAAGLASLQAALTAGQSWWAVGLYVFNETEPPNNYAIINSDDNPASNPVPTLYVKYTGNFSFNLNGAYYENGTFAGPVSVGIITANETETFVLNGTKNLTFVNLPESFIWSVGSGIIRRIAVIDKAENMTILIPEDTFSVFEFLIRDYIGAIGRQELYIETVRFVNGTGTVVERSKVQDQVNGVPMSLVLNKFYQVNLVFDGRTIVFDFTPNVDPTPILFLRNFPFSDKNQAINRYITVDSSRNATGTVITGNYVSSISGTTLVTYTVRLSNNTIVYQANSTADTVTFVFNPAVNTTTYKATFSIIHQNFTGTRYQTTWLPGIRDYDSPPDFGVIGGFSGIEGTYMTGLVIIIFVAGAFTNKYILPGAAVIVIMAGILSNIGLLPFNNIQLASAAIAVGLLAVVMWRNR